ncbi:MAG: archease [Nitrospirota bacterium]
MAYEVLDLSGDVGVRARGGSLPEAFGEAALAMYSLITEPAAIRPEEVRRVEVRSHSREGLLVSWLNELIYLFDVHGFVGKSVEFESFEDTALVAEVRGERFDPQRHEGGLLLKAATYHGLTLEQGPEGYRLEIMFDI